MSDDTDPTTASAPPVVPHAEPPTSVSVVIDRDAKVKISKRPIYLAAAAVVAFAAFTVVWFDSRADDQYEPGPVALALIDAIRSDGGEVTIPDEELACVDRIGAAIDPEDVRNGMQVTDPSLSEESKAFVGAMLDDCLSRDTRVQMLSQSVTFAGQPVTGEKAVCVAERIDDDVVDHGGYTELAADLEGQTTFLQAMFGAMAGCGVMGG